MSVTIGQQLSDILRRKVEGALVISGEMDKLLTKERIMIIVRHLKGIVKELEKMLEEMGTDNAK